MAPPETPRVVSGPVNGRVVSWQWNGARTALLALVDGPEGRRLWIVRTDGSTRDVTPPGGAPRRAQWQ
jgi:hypothetical protein